MADKPVVKYTCEWENVTAWLRRMRVPGGWLVILIENQTSNICFIADADGLWVLQTS